MSVFKAAVVGAGTMGGEIAQVISFADIPVVLKDIDREYVDLGLEKARSLYQARVDGGKMSDDQLYEKMSLIEGTTGYDSFGDVDFVIEAVPERMDIKKAVFAELDEVTPGHAILGSNTSGLSVAEFGRATMRPDKVVGVHFFYPASMMRLVEVISSEHTSEETAQAAINFAQAIRKMPIHCGEVPGFVVNRVLMAAVSEVWRYQNETDRSVEEIDKEIAEAKVTPMGPFFLSDLLGLDTVMHVAEHMRESYGDRFYVSPKMRELVEAGHYGQKTGKGFYEHAAQN